MAETEPRMPAVRARIAREDGRRQPATCLSHHPRAEELPIDHLGRLRSPVAATRSGNMQGL